MKAILQENYGSPNVLSLQEIEKPVPTDDQVLIKIHSVSINGSDKENLAGKPFYARIGGLWKPRNPILGSDIAGHVEAIGNNITEFKPGDEIFGEIPNYRGGLAEFVCTEPHTLAIKPQALSFETAAAIPQAGTITWQGIREQGNVQAGQKVLINGAGGSGGSFAIQLAKLYGAEVTAVDNAHKLEFMRSLGADEVIDYKQKDFTQNGEQYDLIFDLIGTRPPSAFPKVLRPNGNYFCVGGSTRLIFKLLLQNNRLKQKTGKNIQMLMVPQNRKDLLAFTELCLSGDITPVIDRRFALADVPDAFRYIESGRAKGKIIINL